MREGGAWWAALPVDLQVHIRAVVRDERHVLARLMVRRARSRLRNVMADGCSTEVLRAEMRIAREIWEGIARLGCYDAIIVRESRRQHDIWAQTIEDPYEMRYSMQALLDEFETTFVPVLWRVAHHTPCAPSASERI